MYLLLEQVEAPRFLLSILFSPVLDAVEWK